MLYRVEIPVSGVRIFHVYAKSAEEAVDLVGSGHGEEFDTCIAEDSDSNNWSAYED